MRWKYGYYWYRWWWWRNQWRDFKSAFNQLASLNSRMQVMEKDHHQLKERVWNYGEVAGNAYARSRQKASEPAQLEVLARRFTQIESQQRHLEAELENLRSQVLP